MLLIIIRHWLTAEDGWTISAVGKLFFIDIYHLISLFSGDHAAVSIDLSINCPQR